MISREQQVFDDVLSKVREAECFAAQRSRKRRREWPRGSVGGYLAWNHYNRLTVIASAESLLAYFPLEDFSEGALRLFMDRRSSGSHQTELVPNYTDATGGGTMLS